MIAIGSLYLWKDSVVTDQKTCQLLSRFSSLSHVSGRTMPAAVTRWPTASVYEAAPPMVTSGSVLSSKMSVFLLARNDRVGDGWTLPSLIAEAELKVGVP